ncbi:MAG: glycosyltransferase family 9 protein [Candidatus Andersenbacteria bacterium]
MKKFLIRHLGNMGDMLFFVSPVLETLKKKYPDSHITFVTAWGFKTTKRPFPFVSKKEFWGDRNQSGFCIALMMHNPHIDELVHWHDEDLSLEGMICAEEGRRFPTWNKSYYEKQKESGKYDGVYELDFGIGYEDNPLDRMYEAIGMSGEMFSDYKIHLTEDDKAIAKAAMEQHSTPRIVLLEGLEGTTTRGWDPGKIPALEAAIKKNYGVKPIWFGGRYTPTFEGRPLTLRENIATLTFCDAAIGVMSGPLHFAAAVGCPTITLYGDQPLHRAAPAYFLNEYIHSPKKYHRTIMGPTNWNEIKFLKDDSTFVNLTPVEVKAQGYENWQNPGRQSTKSCLAVITVDEIMVVLADVLATD